MDKNTLNKSNITPKPNKIILQLLIIIKCFKNRFDIGENFYEIIDPDCQTENVISFQRSTGIVKYNIILYFNTKKIPSYILC